MFVADKIHALSIVHHTHHHNPMKAFTRLSLYVILLAINFKSDARVYYSRPVSGNWNSAASWSTLTYGSATNSGTFPVAGDTALIGDGYSITVNTGCACSYLQIGQGTSGIVTFNTSGNRTLTVSGDIDISANGKLWYNGNGGRSHTINLGGNLTNNGIIDFYSDANDVVNITFNSTTNTIVSGSGTWDIYNVSINKSGSSPSVDMQVYAFEGAIRNTFSTTSGKYIHNNSGTFDCSPSLNFTIPDPVEIEIPMGGMNFASNANYLYLSGTLTIDGGSCSVGSATGTQGIRTSKTGTNVPLLNISSGSMTLNGGITYRTSFSADPFYFKMTGGTLSIECGTTGSANEALKITDVAGSVFEMSGGTIIFQKPNATGGALIDVDICGTNGAVYTTGGTMLFGNASTPASSIFNFKPYANAVYPHMEVANSNSTLKPSPGSGNTAHYRFLSLKIDAGAAFDNRSFSGTQGDSKDMYLVGNSGGVAFQNGGTFTQRTGAVIFADDTLQHIGGSSATTFYDFEMSNAAGALLESSITVSNILTLTNGVLYTTPTELLTLSSSASTGVGSSASYVEGPMVRTVATATPTTLNFPIGDGGFWRPSVLAVDHSSATSVTYWGQVVNIPAASLPYTLPASLSQVSLVRYYQFVRQSVANFQSATFKIYYGTDNGVTDPSNLRVAQVVGTAWVNEGGTGSAAGSGNITSSSFTSFNNIFALGNATGGSNPLPVKWLSFDVSNKHDSNRLTWSTGSEINNDRFEIQRSEDGKEFYTIGMVIGSGNSTTRKDYEYNDRTDASGTVYYRIAQIDFDGEVSFSEIKSIQATNNSVVLFPTISNGSEISIKNSDGGDEELNVDIYNSGGQKIFSRRISHDVQNLIEGEQVLVAGKYFAVVDGIGVHSIMPFFVVR